MITLENCLEERKNIFINGTGRYFCVCNWNMYFYINSEPRYKQFSDWLTQNVNNSGKYYLLSHVMCV